MRVFLQDFFHIMQFLRIFSQDVDFLNGFVFQTNFQIIFTNSFLSQGYFFRWLGLFEWGLLQDLDFYSTYIYKEYFKGFFTKTFRKLIFFDIYKRLLQNNNIFAKAIRTKFLDFWLDYQVHSLKGLSEPNF